jgi:hypothetical protein
MNWTDRWAPPAPTRKTSGELRKFGLVMAGAFGILGSLAAWWRHKPWGIYVVGLAAVFLLAGLLAPRVLEPVERVWMAFAERLGRVSTFIILTVSFYLVITPVGVLRRIFAKQTMAKPTDPPAPSYWVPVEPGGSASRPDKPF